ncbi:MAG: AraC family transcriptional regulator [Microlunatus sp.]
MSDLPHSLGSSAGVPGSDAADESAGAFYVTCDTSMTGTSFPAHRHDGDELMWARQGRYDVLVEDRRLAMSANQVMWMPAHTVHQAELHRQGDLVCLFAASSLRPDGDHWRRPRVLECSSLMAALLEHLIDEGRPRRERERCRELLYCLLEEAPESTGTLAIPRDSRGERVAKALLADPGLRWGLAEWATEVGASERTLARIFASETGVSFGDWRKAVRMNAALALLADGIPIHTVATRVGNLTASSFIETFRQTFGTTPATFRRSQQARLR